ncbi:MAG TPA: hypothetical protein VIB99_05365 [Candidatus Limnocylindrales bacterium]
MTEIITESFCERCGTRYTFEAANPKKRRIGKLKVLSKGLKNYVLSDDASLDEALAEARSDEQRELSGGQLDAFHQTFQFCMSCRQYTCANCWNEPEGRCLTCAPLSVAAPGLLRSPFDDLLAGGGISPLVNPDPLAQAAPDEGQLLAEAGPLDEVAPAAVVGSAWPTIDLFRAPDAEPTADASEMAAQPEVAAEGPADDLEPAAEAEALTEPAEQVELSSAADFWMRPFTGYAPVAEPTNGNGSGHHHDEPVGELAAEAVILSHEPDGVVAPAEPEAAAIAEVAPEPVSEPIAVAEPEPVAVAEPEPVEDPAAAQRADELAAHTTRLLGRFRAGTPGSKSTPQIEPEAPGVLPAAAVAPPEPAVEDRGPAAPVEAAAALAGASNEPSAGPGTDVVEMPTWPIVDRRRPVAPPPVSEPAVAPLPPVAPAPAVAPVPPVAPPPEVPLQARSVAAPVVTRQTAPPQWPAPRTPGPDLSVPPFWASGDAGRSSREADLWNASAQEVLGSSSQVAPQPGVQSCVKCGLSLSANARFCRRCGSPQG